jgi:hypothetical protein
VTAEFVVEVEPWQAAAATARPSNLIRAVNEAVREDAAPLDATEAIGFFCECRSGCFTVCWLTAAEFDVRLTTEDWILASGHAPFVTSRPQDDQPARSAHVREVGQALMSLAVERGQSVPDSA